MTRDLYLREALKYVPHLLELADRNPLSPTFGCFDRAFWHYRTADFPSGMFQEAVLPLALLYKLDHPSNPFYKNVRIFDLVKGGIEFSIQSAHPDSSCDDYFPYERAAGAAGFALYACAEACRQLGLAETQPHFLEFFKRRAYYLAEKGMQESGILSNHKALIVLAVYEVFLLTGDAGLKKQADAALQKLLSLQDAEGWFPEYEGCDPGYLTFTIGFLAKYRQISGDESVTEPLSRAVEFAAHFIHPDGSYGGEYGSRNTFHFMPHGFELTSGDTPAALPAARAFLKSLESGSRSYIEDDRIMIHYVYDYLQAYQDFAGEAEEGPRKDDASEIKVFKNAALAVGRSGNIYSVFSLKKGTGKIFQGERLIYSDAGLAGKDSRGHLFSSQVFGAAESAVLEGGQLKLAGKVFKQTQTLFSPFTFWLFRSFMIFLGRFLNENTVRRMLQKKAILKKKVPVPLIWEKTVDLEKGKVKWSLELTSYGFDIKDLAIASDATFIYVATSQPYQKGNLLSWVNLSDKIHGLRQSGRIDFELNPA